MSFRKFVREHANETISYYARGIMMGLADIIPGVSGGTIALITGIYSRLISALGSTDPSMLWDLLKGDLPTAREKIQGLDLPFLIPLGAGIFTIFILGTRLIKYLIGQFTIPTYSFFSGLILASALLIQRRIDYPIPRRTIWFFAGGLIAWFVSGVSSLTLHHGPFILLISGVLASCAMILPGVSGAFVLLLMGQYEHILGAVESFLARYPTLIVFGCGALLGILGFSRILRILLAKYRQQTLCFLVGLMLGALRRPVELMISQGGSQSYQFPDSLPYFAVICGLLGALLIWALHALSPEQVG